ncbi:hypothetical protein OYC64_018318 [Pagothenia borchgrevinki]|uniref:C2H2-type domain-containing protein n=1 Tax=Pagothenia borchgrevinki TaxID=8213 RepID=A0ABD2GPJ7_PAGBO
MEAIGTKRPKVHSISSCFLCDDCPDNLEALHLLQHYKAANGEAIDSAALDPSFAALLSGAGVVLEEPPVDDLLSLLKTYFASNANPSEKELTKISESVSFPVDVVRKWFAKINFRKNVGKDVSNNNGHAEEDSSQEIFNIASSADAPGSLHKHISSQGTTGPSSSQQEKILRGQTINPPQIGKHINVITGAQLRSLAVLHKSASCSAKERKKRRLENDPYPCDLCYKVFKAVSSLLWHKYEHTGKRPFECKVCKKAFKHQHHLIEHARLHSGTNPFSAKSAGSVSLTPDRTPSTTLAATLPAARISVLTLTRFETSQRVTPQTCMDRSLTLGLRPQLDSDERGRYKRTFTTSSVMLWRSSWRTTGETTAQPGEE